MLARLSVGCLFIMGCEGEPATATMEEQLVRDEVILPGGRDLGPEPGEHWLRHRYDVSFKWPRVFAAGAMADTMEFAATWDRLPSLYQKVRAAILPHALIMAHFSHAYPDGCSIYFTFMTGRARAGRVHSTPRPSVLDDQRRYDEIWQAGIAAALSAGATIGHHHGVGRLRGAVLVDEQGEDWRGLWRSARRWTQAGCAMRAGCFRACSFRPNPSCWQRRGRCRSTRSRFWSRPRRSVFAGTGTKLRQKRADARGLAPWAYARTLGMRCAARFRRKPVCRRVGCMTAGFSFSWQKARWGRGLLLAIPPQPAPRRSTGPDFGSAFRRWTVPEHLSDCGRDAAGRTIFGGPACADMWL